MKRIRGKKIPGTGIAFGFDRTLEAAEKLGLVPQFKTLTQILVTIFSPDLYSPALTLSRSLRQGGVNTELYPDPNTKLDKQLKYASAKGIPFVAILGPEEIEKDIVTLKNMASGEQKTLTQPDLISSLKSTS